MRVISKFTVFLIWLIFLTSCFGKPSIQFKETTFDFGSTKVGDELVHVFEFTNVGQSTLEISKVKPSCGCTSVLLSDKEIKPGDTGKIEVKLKTSSASLISKNIYVFTNDEDNEKVTLIIKANVLEDKSINRNTKEKSK